MDDLALIRKEKHEKFIRKKRLENLLKKYGELLELDPIKLAAHRLGNFARRNIFPEPVNVNALWYEIPGRFRVRLRMGALNLINWPEQIKQEKEKAAQEKPKPTAPPPNGFLGMDDSDDDDNWVTIPEHPGQLKPFHRHGWVSTVKKTRPAPSPPPGFTSILSPLPQYAKNITDLVTTVQQNPLKAIEDLTKLASGGIVHHSPKQHKTPEEMAMEKAMKESMKETPPDADPEEMMLQKMLQDSLQDSKAKEDADGSDSSDDDDEVDDEELAKAIALSEEKNEPKPNEASKEDEDLAKAIMASQEEEDIAPDNPHIEIPEMWMGFDLRYLGNNLDEPINFSGHSMYLTPQQRYWVERQWALVDETRPTGHNFVQSMKYWRVEMQDLISQGDLMVV